MFEENPRDVGHEMDGLSVVYGDESLPRLYENSRISSDQIAGQPGISTIFSCWNQMVDALQRFDFIPSALLGIVKRAVALGRYLQNPLAMVATLCGPEREILSWKLSPLERYLAADEKYDMIERIMVGVTNQVGLDLNLAANHEWLFAPLQYISGLGPRKASSLQKSLVRAGAIFSPKDLLTTHGLGRKIFFNAAGFLLVRRSGLAASGGQFFDLLDDTRIHPENYALAQEIAKDIYREDDDALEMAVEHDKDCLSKRETLYTVKLELIEGFQDWRRQYEEPSQDEEFFMISGETEDTLAEGRTVQATVRRVQAQRAICALESGLTGMLTREDYSDDWRDSDLTEKLREGDILTCKIKSILKNRYEVFLTCRENDTRSNRHQIVRNPDPYHHEDRSSLQSEQEKARTGKELVKKHFKPRMIVHPRFQNITSDEAIEACV
ncbi:Transcription elongation factor spt6 [Ancistrocladus abbreviatus]